MIKKGCVKEANVKSPVNRKDFLYRLSLEKNKKNWKLERGRRKEESELRAERRTFTKEGNLGK